MIFSNSNPRFPDKGLITMPELNAKITKSLNKTTPGLQIWRIEVGSKRSRGILGQSSIWKKKPAFQGTGILSCLSLGSAIF